nr:PREDICTED: protein NATD1 [Apteryx mantelli mantelli]
MSKCHQKQIPARLFQHVRPPLRPQPFLMALRAGSGCHDRAVLLYEYVGKRIVDLQHTEVPDAYRGRGIAKHLAKGSRWERMGPSQGLGGTGSGSGCHDRAVLLYEYVGKRIVDLQHTEVPDAYRGRGIAKHLAKAALDFVVEEDLKAHLTCWYIQKYVKENPLPQYLEHLQP